MIKKVYFDYDRIALGTSEGPEAYYGEAYAPEEMDIEGGYLVTGKHYFDILKDNGALKQIALANSPAKMDVIAEAVREHERFINQYNSRQMTPLDLSKELSQIWTMARFNVESAN